jgi:predicted CoA-binding protein
MSLPVAIIGASHKPHRYAHRAQVMLMEHGHRVFPVSGNGRSILDVKGYTCISEIDEPIDTVALYLNPERHQPLVEDILKAQPRRIIFNPGTESDHLIDTYSEQGIDAMRACTLVMLQTQQF